MNVNDFLPFCATNTGTNLLSQGNYVTDAQRPIGNQPGIARSQLVNKALRQPTYVVSQLAQYISNQLAVDVLDNAVPAQLLSQMMGTFQPLVPNFTKLLSGTSTWNATVYFFCASANATAGATYTNNSVTYTVVTTISSGAILRVTGNGAPTANGGTLTKATGTGDATIIFYAFRSAAYLNVEMVGGGGAGGNGRGATATDGGNGSNTTFGSSLLVAGGGFGGGGTAGSGLVGGAGGTASLGSGPFGIAFSGGSGTGGMGVVNVSNPPQSAGGCGASTPFGGGGGGGGFLNAGSTDTNGYDATPNTGSGGGGGGYFATSTASAGGGGAGGYVKAMIVVPSFSYVYAVGTGGTVAANTIQGGLGGSGLILVTEHFQ